MKNDVPIIKPKISRNGSVRSLSFNNGSNLDRSSSDHPPTSIPHNSCFLVNGKERKLSNSYLRFQRRYSKHGTRDATYDPKDGSVHMHLRGKPVQLFAPSHLKESYSLASNSSNGSSLSLSFSTSSEESVKKCLSLDWVYGYRGKDARSNLFLLPTGELVYFLASVVVLFHPETQKQRHYLGHTEEVKCLTIHPNKLLIASGQSTSGHDKKEHKPHVRIWNSANLNTQCIIGLGDFERSVVCLSFSKHGSNHLVAIDEGSDHTMTVWDTQTNHGKKLAEVKCSNKETVVAAEFHPLDPELIVTCGKGHVNFWTLDQNTWTMSRKTGCFDAAKDKPKYVTCLAFASNGDLLTGDSYGNVCVWRRGYNAVTKSLKKIHNGPVFAICVLKDGSLVTGGGKDSLLVHFDPNYKKLEETFLNENLGAIRTICQGKQNEQLLIGTTHNSLLSGDFENGIIDILIRGHDDEVKSGSSPETGHFVTHSQDKWIHVWDSANHNVFWSYKSHETPVCCCFSNDGTILLIGLDTGSWKVIDFQSKKTLAEYHDTGNDAIECLQFSPNGLMLAVGNRAGILHLYQVSNRKFNRIGRCMDDGKKQRSSSTGSPINYISQAVSNLSIDWSDDSCYIRSMSQEASLCYWNANTCRQVSNHSTLRDITWSTHNCLITFDTIGIWPETVDGIDLTTGCKNVSNTLFVSGDDFGKIKVYSYPVCWPKANFSTFGGHSCPVSSVTFTKNEQFLISTGGKDMSILQWKLT